MMKLSLMNPVKGSECQRKNSRKKNTTINKHLILKSDRATICMTLGCLESSSGYTFGLKNNHLSGNVALLFQRVVNVKVTTCPRVHSGVVGLCIR